MIEFLRHAISSSEIHDRSNMISRSDLNDRIPAPLNSIIYISL